MKKKFPKRILAFIMSMTIVLPTVTFTMPSVEVEAGVGSAVAGKLLSVGLRVASKATAKAATKVDNPDLAKTLSIASMMMKNPTGRTLTKLTNLCNQILAEVKAIDKKLDDYKASLDRQNAESNVKERYDKMTQAYTECITNMLSPNSSYTNPSFALDAYDEYLQAACDYANGKNGVTEADVKSAQDELIKAYKSMMGTSSGTNSPDKLRRIMFTDPELNDAVANNFRNILESMSRRLIDTKSDQYVECAARYAYEVFRFSHEQLEYVRTAVDAQVMAIVRLENVYSEFLAEKGEYLATYDGADRDELIESWREEVKDYDKMFSTVNSRINTMMSQKMTIDSAKHISMAVTDYMTPEDASKTMLKLDNFKDSYKEDDRQKYDGIHTYIQSSKSNNKANYFKSNVEFERLMTTTATGNHVFYILSKSYGESALSSSALDFKYDVKGDPDYHVASADYRNLIGSHYHDNINTFTVSSRNSNSAMQELFSGNAFKLYNSKPADFLSDYLVKDKNAYLISSDWYYGKRGVSTTYEHFYLNNMNDPASDGGLGWNDISGKDLQNGGKYYTMVLYNQGNDYKKHLSIETGSGVVDAKLICGDTTVTAKDNEKIIPSGKTFTLKFKLGSNLALGKVELERNNNYFSGDNAAYIQTETLAEEDETELFQQDSDGYYTMDLIMPYSDTTIKISVAEHTHTYDKDGICEDCGKYEPMELMADGSYQIKNKGQFMNFAAKVSGDINETANYDKKDPGTNAVLTADIDISGMEWKPIANYNGKFNGQGHTVSGLTITQTKSYAGLFGYINDSAVVKNLTVKGDISMKVPCENIGGVIAYLRNGASAENVVSYVNIKDNGNVCTHIGGVVGGAYSNQSIKCRVKNCMNYATVSLDKTSDCVGGVIGYAYNTEIISSANIGDVSSKAENACVGGVLGYSNNSDTLLADCYNYGKVSNNNSDKNCGGIIGLAKRSFRTDGLLYMLSGSAPASFGKSSSGKAECSAIGKDVFSSGEATYNLNKKQGEFYQNLGQDAYPVTDSTHGMVFFSNNKYTNTANLSYASVSLYNAEEEEPESEKPETDTENEAEEFPAETAEESSESETKPSEGEMRFSYDGTAQRPGVTVTLDGKTLVGGVDYTVSVKDNVEVGTASLVIKGIGNYEGQVEKTFEICPKSPKIHDLSVEAGGLTLFIKKVKDEISGYEIGYRKEGNTEWESVDIKKGEDPGKLKSQLERGTNYEFRIRVYKTTDGENRYSEWSRTKVFKTAQ